MIACRDLTELVAEYVEGRLSLPDRLRFRLHLVGCPGCRAYLRQLEDAVRALGALPEPELPDAVREELLRRFDGWRR